MSIGLNLEIEDRGKVENRVLPSVPAYSPGGRNVTAAGLSGSGRLLVAVSPIALFVSFFLLIKYLEDTWFGVAQYWLVGWDFFAHLMMVEMPAVALIVARRPLSELGLTRAQLEDRQNRNLRIAALGGIAAFWLAFGLAPALAFGHRPMLPLPPNFFAQGWGQGGNFIGWFLTIIFTMVFCGVGEEVLFRGYIQGQLNRALGRPFQFRGVSFGPALFISAAIFGLGHGINTYNPMIDWTALRMDWGAAAATSAQGLLFGFLYEATGGIAAPAALHAAIGLFFGAIVFS